MQEQGPLILGAGGRLGQAFRTLWDSGLWPDRAEPLWQHRQRSPVQGNSVFWDLLSDAPPDDDRLRAVRGVIVLAGVTSGTDEDLARNTDLARAAINLALFHDLGPVLLCSTAAVYGRAAGAQDETMPCHPVNAYGQAKLAMEAATAPDDATCLRIANIAGSDQLFGSAARGGVRLDRFNDGRGPERAYIGPLTLARTMLALIKHRLEGRSLPRIINIATPHAVQMEDLLGAAGVPFNWVPASPTALASVTLDTGRLGGIVPLSSDTASPATLVTEARAAGWHPA